MELKAIAFKADKDTAKLLQKLAVNGYAGNQSEVLRTLIHREAQRAGFLPATQATDRARESVR